MNFGINFFVTSLLLGLGLAIDGFLLSLTNGLNYNKTTKLKTLFSATIFALFQIIAVIVGWFCVAKLVNSFMFVEDVVSIISLVVLVFLGTKMIVNGAKKHYKKHNTVQNNKILKFSFKKNKNSSAIQNKKNKRPLKVIIKNKCKIIKSNLLSGKDISKNSKQKTRTWLGALLLQGLVTSLDALSVGFVISKNSFVLAFVTAVIIGLTTFSMYLLGFTIGKKFGEKIGDFAEILGGVVLIILGLEIFITSIIK